jgi:hypothetical protein
MIMKGENLIDRTYVLYSYFCSVVNIKTIVTTACIIYIYVYKKIHNDKLTETIQNYLLFNKKSLKIPKG